MGQGDLRARTRAGARAHDPGIAAATVVVAVIGFAVAGVQLASGVPSARSALLALVGFAAAAMLSVIPISLSVSRRSALEAEYGDLVQNADAVVWWLAEGSSAYGSISAGASRILGHRHDELLSVARWQELVHPEDRGVLTESRRRALEEMTSGEVDYRMLGADGSWRWLREALSTEPPTARSSARLRGVVVDVTSRRVTEAERELYHEVVEHIETAIIVARPSDRLDGALAIEAANPAAGTLFGLAPERMAGIPVTGLAGAPGDDVVLRAHLVARGGDAFAVERVDGVGTDPTKVFTVRAFGLPGGAVGLGFDDVTAAAVVSAALRRQALHDGLTGLPNRTLLRDRLQTALADARRRSERVALVLLDLNHFKDVNDALGHQYGDELLMAFADRLRHLLRDCDTIARLGGDEFALLLTQATDEGAIEVVEKVIDAMAEPFALHGITVKSTASLGIAVYPDDAEDADLLTQRADVAMYAAKRTGGGWRVYSPADDQSSIERLTLLADLHHELTRTRSESLGLHYQPVLDLGGRGITGVEALLRWNHPGFGTLAPEMVVGLAEVSGLADDLAKHVTRAAIATSSRWRDQGVELCMAVNLSARNLSDRQLTDWIGALLREFDVPPESLKCEVTESELMDDPILSLEVLARLRDIGVRTAIDDFGTGYSSLSYLRRLPVDEIKIDRSFVLQMADDDNDRMIVRTVIDLAHNLGLRVLAEGVEDERTLQLLRSLGCDEIQGHLVGRPMTADRLLASVRPQVSRRPRDPAPRRSPAFEPGTPLR